MHSNTRQCKQAMVTRAPLVSVIMPVYNAAEYVVEAVNSVCNQTVDNFELLIIDDCSRDGSWVLLQQLAKQDKRIRLFRNSYRKGLALSLNVLIPKTRGRYIARMDADDISHAQRFEHQITYLRRNPQTVACGGHVYIIDEYGDIIGRKRFPTSSAACRAWIVNYMVIQPPLLMARAEAMHSYRYDNSIFGNDDISMHFKLLSRGEFGNVDGFIFKYRKRPDSLTHANPKKVYFLALRVRLKAILDGIYTPSPVHASLAVIETAIVALLPNSAITELFELIRLKDSVRLYIHWSVVRPTLLMKRLK